jgi:hypothetical protein
LSRAPRAREPGLAKVQRTLKPGGLLVSGTRAYVIRYSLRQWGWYRGGFRARRAELEEQ